MKNLYLNLFFTNLRKYNEGKMNGSWVNILKINDWNKFMKTFDDEYFISDFEANFNIDMEYISIDELESFQEFINYVNIEDKQDIAIDLLDLKIDLYKVFEILKNETYMYIKDIKTDEELGEEIIENDPQFYNLSDNIKIYLDREDIGRDFRLNNKGGFVNGNYITY